MSKPRKQVNRDAYVRWRDNDPAKYVFRAARRRAKVDGLAFTATVEDIRRLLQPMVCSITGIPLRWDTSIKRDDLAPSLDRIDNSQGYTPGNIRITCWRVNNMRGNLSDAEFLQYARLIVEGMTR